MIQIYTGNGKGKTTAAIGLALRAIGANKKVAIIQFMKKGDSSEIKAIKKYKLPINIFSFGIGFYKILGDKHTTNEHKNICKKAIKKTKEIIQSNMFDIIILDEVNVAIKLGLIDTEEVVSLCQSKKDGDIILTGRDADKKLIKIADLVTEMKKNKHYFDIGIKARRGIEY